MFFVFCSITSKKGEQYSTKFCSEVGYILIDYFSSKKTRRDETTNYLYLDIEVKYRKPNLFWTVFPWVKKY